MLKLKNISINLEDFYLNNLSLTVKKGDYYVILGESGAGKSVILELISGLRKPNSGTIFFNGKNITNIPVQKRNIGLVFQDYAVFPHLNVFNNIAYSVRNKGFLQQEIKEKVNFQAKQTGISHLLKRKTTELSGGELQRVALARTLILKPELLLLDEPLGASDVLLKENLRNLLRKLNKSGQTIIHITHDYEEALSLANKIAVIHSGKLIQEGIPDKIFNHPKSEFIAGLTGVKNFFKAKYISDNELIINDSVIIRVNPEKINCKGYAVIPSKAIIISKNKPETSALNNFKGKIKNIIPARYGKEIIVDIGVKLSVVVTNQSVAKLNLTEEKETYISFKANSVRFIKKN